MIILILHYKDFIFKITIHFKLFQHIACYIKCYNHSSYSMYSNKFLFLTIKLISLDVM